MEPSHSCAETQSADILRHEWQLSVFKTTHRLSSCRIGLVGLRSLVLRSLTWRSSDRRFQSAMEIRRSQDCLSPKSSERACCRIKLQRLRQIELCD